MSKKENKRWIDGNEDVCPLAMLCMLKKNKTKERQHELRVILEADC